MDLERLVKGDPLDSLASCNLLFLSFGGGGGSSLGLLTPFTTLLSEPTADLDGPSPSPSPSSSVCELLDPISSDMMELTSSTKLSARFFFSRTSPSLGAASFLILESESLMAATLLLSFRPP